jgi:hypothetical protein
MKDENFKNLIDKYDAGHSSIQEEKLLHNNINEKDTAMKAWSTFVQNHKIETPKNFNEQLWEEFEPKTNSKRGCF